MFQALVVEHRQDRTIVYPYGPNVKSHCVYLEADGSYVAHKLNSNKLGKLDKAREQHSLQDLQELCKLVIDPIPAKR